MGRPSHSRKRRGQAKGDVLEPAADTEDSRFNIALARGIAVLRAFDVDDQFLGNTEIAARIAVPKPTVSRLTYTLTELGYLSYREEVGKYELAPGILGLAYPYLANMPVPAIARPFMNELAKSTQANVGLAILDGLSAVYLESASGEPNMNRRQRVGFRLPLARTATGRACIAAMDTEQRERTLERLRQVYPDEWHLLRDQIEDAITQVRVRGYCIVAGTYSRTNNMVAVPFALQDGRTILAFNCGGHARIHTVKKLAQYGPRLIKLASAVRRQLG
ncbi:MAG: IclR family transcriptional regulator [Bradyrhizobium sp.]